MMDEVRQRRWPIVLAALALTYLVVAVFWPVVRFEFALYDVRKQLLDNPCLQQLTAENLKHIFTSRCVTSYYPIRSLTYALDCQLWGLHAGGFKLTNGLIHWVNVLLVLWLVLRLFRHPQFAEQSLGWQDIFVATFAAGVFAVHPVVVEPVVWVPGREELLMTLGALGCIHFHLAGHRLSENGGRAPAVIACHVSAAFCCTVACLSNAVAAVIPLLIVTWDLLILVRPKLSRIVYATSALWVIGGVTIVIKRLGADRGLVATEVDAFSFERVTLVLNVYWLNLKTLLWPAQLAIEYPRVSPQGLLDAEVLLGGIAAGVTCTLLWLLRRNKLILFGSAWFCLTLGPTAQILPHHVHRVDRFLYLPLVGLTIAIAMGLRSLACAPKVRRLPAGILAAAGGLGLVVLLTLDMLTAHQVQTWRDARAMWEQCLKVDPEFVPALRSLAGLLATCPQDDLRDYDLAIRLAERACRLTEGSDVHLVMIVAGIYAQAGRHEMAITATEKAIAPTVPTLATCI